MPSLLARLVRALPTSLARGRTAPGVQAPPHQATVVHAVDIAATIEQALASAGLRPPAPAASSEPAVSAPVTAPRARVARPSPRVPRPRVQGKQTRRRAAEARVPIDAPARGRSLARSFGNASGTRAYTLYLPAGYRDDAERRHPLLLMLHGCTQDPADFAAGTGMNALADAHGLLVAYPAQAQRDNGSRCWNWFRRQDQQRDTGEAAILAGIVGDIAADHRVDPARVYVAGLSAGGAMAVILGRTHPDVFAAVGAHSGLPFGAAHDVGSAFAAMQGNAASRAAPARARDASGMDARCVPTIVFHGTADRTVHPINGASIARDAAPAGALPTPAASQAGGRRYTLASSVDPEGRTQVEHWLVEGAGHTWSGGHPSGSHVDPAGPNASAEMVRFFLQHARAD